MEGGTEAVTEEVESPRPSHSLLMGCHRRAWSAPTCAARAAAMTEAGCGGIWTSVVGKSAIDAGLRVTVPADPPPQELYLARDTLCEPVSPARPRAPLRPSG